MQVRACGRFSSPVPIPCDAAFCRADLARSLAVADEIIVAGVFRSEAVPENERLELPELATDIQNHGRRARLIANADEIIETIAPEMRSGDVVAILSNGGFGGIYEKLPARLRALAVDAARYRFRKRSGQPMKRFAFSDALSAPADPRGSACLRPLRASLRHNQLHRLSHKSPATSRGSPDHRCRKDPHNATCSFPSGMRFIRSATSRNM